VLEGGASEDQVDHHHRHDERRRTEDRRTRAALQRDATRVECAEDGTRVPT